MGVFLLQHLATMWILGSKLKKIKQNHCYVVASKIAEHIQHACRHDEFNLHALEVVSSSQ